MRALLGGKLERAESLAGDALATGASAESVAAPQYYGIQLLAIRREQGRMGELEDAATAFVNANPDRPAWRAALADLLLHGGRHERAQAVLDELGARGFSDIPRDGDWMTAMALGAEVAAGLQDARHSAELYELLSPYGDQIVVIGLGAVCLGSAARYLGRLATTLGRTREAAEHFEHALSANVRIGAVAELAHTQLDYALLLGRAHPASELIDSAAEAATRLGLPAVAARVEGILARRHGGRYPPPVA
jgi:tetratricopeptide (TPR) repeat protein